MTSNQSNQSVNNSPNNRHYIIAAAVGVLMVIAIAWLGYASADKNQRLEQAYTEINETHTLQAELENEYNASLAELDGLKGSNSEMNALIETQKAELVAQKDKISLLLKDRTKLDQARKEINNLKSTMSGYMTELDKLQAENQELVVTRDNLVVEKEAVSNNLQTKVMENTQLAEAKAMLVSQNDELARSVHIGSVIKVRDVKVDGLKVRSNGKVAEKKSAKKIDQLKVCFTTTSNEVVAPGVEQFYIRIVNPRGETLAMEDLGSGAMTNEKTGEEVRFTQTAETEYFNDEQNLCMLWNPTGNFNSGKYVVEIYNKGFLAGTGSFELK